MLVETVSMEGGCVLSVQLYTFTDLCVIAGNSIVSHLHCTMANNFPEKGVTKCYGKMKCECICVMVTHIPQ